MRTDSYDVAIIGGGIVGVATALELARKQPDLRILLLEKEPALASHQTGRNSGVIHAGVYYAPGSIKARFCRAGVEATLSFCRDEGLPVEQCGKLIVATSDDDLPRLDALYQRGAENGLSLDLLDATELRRREPHITGKRAIFTPLTGIVDYGAVTRRMAERAADLGVEIRTGAELRQFREEATGVTLEVAYSGKGAVTSPPDEDAASPEIGGAAERGSHEIVCPRGDRVSSVGANKDPGRSGRRGKAPAPLEKGQAVIRAKQVILCAGLMADRLARQCGLDLDFRIIPFRGDYYRLRPERDQLISHLIYPVPDPALPFLGVHLTKMIGDYLTVGPNAVLAFAREGYRFAQVSPRDLAEILAYPGFRKLARKFLRQGLAEMGNALSRRRYLALCQRYCPELVLEDLLPYRSGVRAQAVMADGTIVHDFLIRSTARTVHVCNAPSPAATSAMPIAAHLVSLATEHFGWRATSR